MLPEGWTAATIGEHADLLTGYAFKSDLYVSSADGIKLLRGDNVAQGRIRWRNVMRYPASQSTVLQRYYLQVGDFVIAMDRTWISAGVKIAEISAADLPCLLVQRVARLRARFSLRQDLLRHLFSGHRFEQYVKNVQTETAVPHISPGDIRNFDFLLPPMPEQRRIAAVLDAWDAAINVYERLISAQHIWRASIENNFLDQGALTRLTDVADISFSGVDKKILEGERAVRLCNYMDVLNNRKLTNNISYDVGSATSGEAERFALKYGDVVFTKDSETAEEIAEPAYVSETLDGVVCGYHLGIARPRNGVSGAYLTHAIRSRKLRQQFVRRANGAIRFGLTLESMRQVELPLPGLERQVAIAGALDAVDDEVARLTALNLLLRQQKRGLMQQLLTGKLRVPDSIDALLPPAPALASAA